MLISLLLICATLPQLTTQAGQCASPRDISLHGTPASLKFQNDKADRLGLERIKNRQELETLIREHRLVLVVESGFYSFDAKLGAADPEHRADYRYARPWVQVFIERELALGHAKTGASFSLTGLVRSEAYQRLLVCGGNRNAAKGETRDTRSTHPTGSTVDISWLHLDQKSRQWMERRLLQLEALGLIEATKEHYNACYHIMVFPKYAKAPPLAPL